MSEFSPVHWLIVLLVLSPLIPIYRILRRMGFNGWLCVLAFVPLANLVTVWVLAYVRWPAVPEKSALEVHVENVR